MKKMYDNIYFEYSLDSSAYRMYKVIAVYLANYAFKDSITAQGILT